MNLFKKKTIKTEEKETVKSPSGKAYINYTWVLKHFPFLMFLALLAIVYIANGHWADETIRQINIMQKQLKNMEYEYKNLKSLEMFRSRESQVTQAAAALGLKTSLVPPVKLVLDSTIVKQQ